MRWVLLRLVKISLRLKESHRVVREGHTVRPRSSTIVVYLAVVYAYGKELNQAAEALQQAEQRNATDPVVMQVKKVLYGAGQPGEQPLGLYIPLPGRR